MVETKPTCRKCKKKDSVKLGIVITQSAVIQVRWHCFRCSMNPVQFLGAISHQNAVDTIEYWRRHLGNEVSIPRSIEELPVIRDYRGSVEPCAVCGAIGTERNHIFPWSYMHIYEDLGEIEHDEMMDWSHVTVPLCKKHHAMWHRLVAPVTKDALDALQNRIQQNGNGQDTAGRPTVERVQRFIREHGD